MPVTRLLPVVPVTNSLPVVLVTRGPLVALVTNSLPVAPETREPLVVLVTSSLPVVLPVVPVINKSTGQDKGKSDKDCLADSGSSGHDRPGDSS